jgi:hypothetical protein
MVVVSRLEAGTFNSVLYVIPNCVPFHATARSPDSGENTFTDTLSEFLFNIDKNTE